MMMDRTLTITRMERGVRTTNQHVRIHVDVMATGQGCTLTFAIPIDDINSYHIGDQLTVTVGA
jgi:hypothetical protein